MERQCGRSEYHGQDPVPAEMKVAAVVNWYGITDVTELLDGPNMRTYAVTWLGNLTNREEIAKRVSPVTYVRAGVPAVLTIHGDADPTVPYQQGVRLHKMLAGVGVANELMTIPGGKHGINCCTLTQRTNAYAKIREFLTRNHVIDGSKPPSTGARPQP